jgi:hypothetical protein
LSITQVSTPSKFDKLFHAANSGDALPVLDLETLQRVKIFVENVLQEQIATATLPTMSLRNQTLLFYHS